MNVWNRKVVFLLSVTLIVWLLGNAGIAVAGDEGLEGVQGVVSHHGGYGVNMELLGWSDGQLRPFYMPHVQKQGNRYILYASELVGTGTYYNPLTKAMEYDGTSIVDITNPRHPTYLFHLPSLYGTPNNEGRANRVCPGDELPGQLYPGKYFLVRSDGQTSQTLWDVTNPAAPVFIMKLIDNLTYTHKMYWDCVSGYIVLPHSTGGTLPAAATRPSWLTTTAIPGGWKSGGGATSTACGTTTGCVVSIMDLHDPYHPKYINEWGLVGQTPTSVPVRAGSGSTGGYPQRPVMIHEDVIFTDPPTNSYPGYGTRLYASYGVGVGGDGWDQVADLNAIININHAVNSDADILAAQIGAMKTSYEFGTHTLWPWLHIPMADFAENYPPGISTVVPGQTNGGAGQPPNPRIQDFVLDTTEGTNNGCVGWRAMARVVDANYLAAGELMTVATIDVPALTKHVDYCANDARFGSHGLSEDIFPPFQNRFQAIAWFSGGVRIFDLRNPFHPKEVAFFVPDSNQNTTQNCATRNGVTACSNTIGIDNCATDDRGYVTCVDRYNTGIFVFELTGEAREALYGKDEGHGWH